MKPAEAGRIYETIATDDQQIYPRVIQPSLLKALKSVFSQYELVTIATEWNSISELVQEKVAEELRKFDYVSVQGLDLTGLQIAEEYRAAIEQKQIAEQQLLRAQTEVLIAEQEAKRYETLNSSLDDQVLYKLFLDKWDGQTSVVPALPGTPGGNGNSVIVNGRR
jgi:regulator of protease activity HflC (stomatin/prohibitin superfamily)